MKLSKLLFISFFILLLMLQPALAEDEPNVLVVTNSSGWLPFSFINEDGRPTGLLIDLWREIGKRTGKKIEFRLVDWNLSLHMVRTKQVDAHAGLFRSNKREEYMDFTRPMEIPLDTKLFISNKLKAKSFIDLGKVPVGVTKGAYEEAFVRENYPSVIMRTFPNSKLVVEAALADEILAFVIDYPSGMYHLHKHGAPEKFGFSETLFTKKIHAAVPKGQKELLDLINLGISRIPEDEFERITQKWVQSVTVTPKWVTPAFTGVIGLLLASLFFFFIHTLRRKALYLTSLEQKVDERTEELLSSNKQLHREIKVRKQAEAEKAKLIADLQEALQKVKTLSGLLPICSSCKKIRDDKGYWNKIEEFIQEHTLAEFSHGLCDDCADQIYGREKWFQDLKKKRDESE